MHKGADIFYELASVFNKEQFLLVGDVDPKYKERFKRLNNVTVSSFGDPKVFFKKSKIMLVPSQCPEPFARIALESMINEIPTLVSCNGGFPEILHESVIGVRHYRTIHQRVAIRECKEVKCFLFGKKKSTALRNGLAL